MNFNGGIIFLPSITKTMEPTSPSLIMIEPAGKVTGYMQSTISRICVSSRFFMKSLSSIAALMSSRDLGVENKESVVRSELVRYCDLVLLTRENHLYDEPTHFNKTTNYMIVGDISGCVSKNIFYKTCNFELFSFSFGFRFDLLNPISAHS